MEKEGCQEKITEHFEARVVRHDGYGGDVVTAVIRIDGVDVVEKEEVGGITLQLLLGYDASGHAQICLVAPQITQKGETEQLERERCGLTRCVNEELGAVGKERQGAVQPALFQVPEQVFGLVRLLQRGMQRIQ